MRKHRPHALVLAVVVVALGLVLARPGNAERNITQNRTSAGIDGTHATLRSVAYTTGASAQSGWRSIASNLQIGALKAVDNSPTESRSSANGNSNSNAGAQKYSNTNKIDAMTGLARASIGLSALPASTPTAAEVGWRSIADNLQIAARAATGQQTGAAPGSTGNASTATGIPGFQPNTHQLPAASASAVLTSTAVSEQVNIEELYAFYVGVRAQQVEAYLTAVATQDQYLQALNDLHLLANAAAAQHARAAAPAPPSAPAPAPAPVTGGGAGGAWAALRECESGGNYAENTGNGFYGAYQFLLSTWQGLGYSGYPNQAPPALQDAAAAALQARSGWGQWPACSRKLGL